MGVRKLIEATEISQNKFFSKLLIGVILFAALLLTAISPDVYSC